jgi:aconitate hydratase
MMSVGRDSLKARRTLSVGTGDYEYFSLEAAVRSLGDMSRLPISLKILLEHILRFEDGRAYKVEDAQAIADWLKERTSEKRCRFDPRAS